MRYEEDEADPKKPRPLTATRKHSGSREQAESGRPLRQDADQDRHAHVC